MTGEAAAMFFMLPVRLTPPPTDPALDLDAVAASFAANLAAGARPLAALGGLPPQVEARSTQAGDGYVLRDAATGREAGVPAPATGQRTP